MCSKYRRSSAYSESEETAYLPKFDHFLDPNKVVWSYGFDHMFEIFYTVIFVARSSKMRKISPEEGELWPKKWSNCFFFAICPDFVSPKRLNISRLVVSVYSITLTKLNLVHSWNTVTLQPKGMFLFKAPVSKLPTGQTTQIQLSDHLWLLPSFVDSYDQLNSFSVKIFLFVNNFNLKGNFIINHCVVNLTNRPPFMWFRKKHYKFGAITFNVFMAISKPMKQAAFAGNALSITGVTPLYNANGPSFFINWRKTSLKPVYVPCGAGYRTLLTTNT